MTDSLTMLFIHCRETMLISFPSSEILFQIRIKSKVHPIPNFYDIQLQGDFFNWASPENASRLPPPPVPPPNSLDSPGMN